MKFSRINNEGPVNRWPFLICEPMAKIDEELTDKQAAFCKHYIHDFNATRAATKAGYSKKTAYSIGSELLNKPEIKERIAYLQNNLAEVTGITKKKVLAETSKIAFSSIAHLHNTWITLKEFESLTAKQKASIASIETQTRKEMGADEVLREIDFVKIKLHDKMKALEILNKMLGFNAPEQAETTIKGIKSFTINPASGGKRTAGK